VDPQQHSMPYVVADSSFSMRHVIFNIVATIDQARWPAPGSEDTELGVLMGPEVRHGASEVYAGVQA
jgi:hypothetical protein